MSFLFFIGNSPQSGTKVIRSRKGNLGNNQGFLRSNRKAKDGYQDGYDLYAAYFVPNKLDPSGNAAGDSCCLKTDTYYKVMGYDTPTACVEDIDSGYSTGLPGVFVGGFLAAGAPIAQKAGAALLSDALTAAGTALASYEAGVLTGSATVCSSEICISYGTQYPCTLYPCMWFGMGYNTLCCK